MNTKHMSLQSFKKQYGNEKACLHALLKYRISEDGQCFNPNCTANINKFYRPLNNRKSFLCASCLTHIYPMSQSIFDHTHVPITHWFEIMYKFCMSRNGISAKELHYQYGISYKTIFRMLHSIRELMSECLDFDFSNSHIEIDESFVSTGNKGLTRHYKFKRGRGCEKNATILCISERGGKAKLFIIEAADSATIIPIILENVPTSSLIFTDSWPAYNQLKSVGYTHEMVNHSVEFVNGSASTNTCENIFSNFKRMFNGTYRNMSDGKLANYLSEFSFRHSHREEIDFGFEKLLQALPSLSLAYNKNKAA